MIIANMAVYAQLRVNSSGNVGIRSNPSSSYSLYVTGSNRSIYSSALKSGATSSDELTSVTGYTYMQGPETAIGVKGQVYGHYESGKSIGVMGETNGNTNGYNFGVAGYLRGSYRGAAIFGTTNNNTTHPFMSSRYAGYFDGDVRISGSFSTTGAISGLSISYASDSQFASPACSAELREHVSSRLTNCHAKSFLIDKTVETDEHEPGTLEKQVFSKHHYGLDAEQLEEVFPDLVYENEDGSKSINYVEMVPILVQAINELKEEITELRGGDVKPQTRALEGEGNSDDVALLSLGENKPNPFSGTTTIPVSIPESVQTAFIYVYDLTGKKVQQTDITARGRQNVQLDASALTDGMYLYSLIADGKVVQTRRMIVEK